MATRTFGPMQPIAYSFVEPKSGLKSATIQINDVPTAFKLLKQKPATTAVPPLADGVRVVTAAEYKQAAACLAEAFGEDDVARYFIDVPDREHWTEEEKWALHVEILEYITYAHILKGLVTTVGDFEGVALCGMWRLNYRLSAEGKRRFFDEFLPLLHDTMHTTLGKREDEAWYLVYIGTKHSGRGKGHARKLIEHVTKLADGEGRACYLESSNARNPPIYRRFGFEVCRTIQLQRGGRNIPLDIMVREPTRQEKKTKGMY
ncbi:hypothetical protein SNOG_08954 [Parastagonospora nodorum SN15]|uniref:N-acetyltransferase domain-containing protein n=1 Tax=Phaeosphaeria nodorum (strain SN15 / ATCC MYA-4574 / FGSC 10173) TaxID=321614 RepID=Q0UH10_PHANO|nr:hypothetical protein SNOG_08954 [Parastagonospora nodorum SN15]EAT84122.2 hypothetical protein SNOG_08954 [Parastagonospora nodorum SN15]